MIALPARSDGAPPYISPLETAVAFTVDLAAALAGQTLLGADLVGATSRYPGQPDAAARPLPTFVGNVVQSGTTLTLLCGDGTQLLGTDVEITLALDVDSTPEATWTLYVPLRVRKGPAPASLLPLQIGDPTGIITASVDAIWDSHTLQHGYDPALQLLYTKRDCIDLEVARLRGQVDFALEGDVTVKASQKVAALVTMRAATEAEIVRREETVVASAQAVCQPLQTTDAIPPPPGRRSGNDPRYSGDLYGSRVGRPF